MGHLKSLPRRFTIYDLEFTAWEGSQERSWSGPGEHREVVQIGAVVVDRARGYDEVRSLDMLVRPKINPVLSDYFTRLTGITQAEVEERGVRFPEALSGLVRFAGEDAPLLGCFGRDPDVLAENCTLHGIALDIATERFVDLRPGVSALLGRPDGSVLSSDLPEVLGFPPPGHAHNALADARAIAAALRYLHSRGRL